MNTGQPEPAKTVKPRAMADGFAEFSASLVPEFAEYAAAEANLSVIEKLLTAHFDMSYLAPYGSTGHGANVTQYSAIDCFAVIPKSRLLENSGKSLDLIRDAIGETFPEAFVTEGRPVIAVPFGPARSERHHIVPAYQQGSDGEHDLFAIPAPGDRWVDICPAAHSVWINELDDNLNKNIKPFIRVVKAWNYFNAQPIWSYYLELCVADFLRKDANIIYSSDLRNFFAYLHKRGLEPFGNTPGCKELVYGTSIEGKNTALSAIGDAVTYSGKALACEEQGNIAEAYYWWRKMFDWRFAQF